MVDEGIATKQDIIELMNHLDKKFDQVNTRITNVQVKQSGISAVISFITAGIVSSVFGLFGVRK